MTVTLLRSAVGLPADSVADIKVNSSEWFSDVFLSRFTWYEQNYRNISHILRIFYRIFTRRRYASLFSFFVIFCTFPQGSKFVVQCSKCPTCLSVMVMSVACNVCTKAYSLQQILPARCPMKLARQESAYTRDMSLCIR